MADPSLLSIQIQDEGGNVRTVVYPVLSTNTLAQVQAFLDAHLDKLDNVVGGVVVAATMTFSMSLAGASALKGAALADHPVKTGGLLGFSATGTKYRHSIYLPTFLGTLIDSSGSIANAGDTATYITSLLNGESQISVQDLGAHALAAFLSGERVNRK